MDFFQNEDARLSYGAEREIALVMSATLRHTLAQSG